MRRRFLTAILTALGAASVPRCFGADAPPRHADMGLGLDKLVSRVPEERRSAVQKAETERFAAFQQAYRAVSQGLHDPEGSYISAAGMDVMAEYRHAQGAPILAENLAFTVSPSRYKAGMPFYNRPQMEALIQIGLPALDPVLKAVAKTDEQIVLERGAVVVDQILGTDFAVLFVKDRVRRETDDIKRLRLERLLTQIDTVERNRTRKRYFGPLAIPPVVDPQPTAKGVTND